MFIYLVSGYDQVIFFFKMHAVHSCFFQKSTYYTQYAVLVPRGIFVLFAILHLLILVASCVVFLHRVSYRVTINTFSQPTNAMRNNYSTVNDYLCITDGSLPFFVLTKPHSHYPVLAPLYVLDDSF